jgi:hypothetical protein
LLQDETDYAAMRDLLIAAGADPLLRGYCTIGDLDWWRSTHADPAHIHKASLWFVDGELAGFIWPSDNSADLLVHPAHRDIEAAMLNWAEAHLAAADGDNAPHATTWAMTQDATRVKLLEANGHHRTEASLTWHTADLSRTIPAPDLPDGFTLRAFAGEEEIEARVEVHRSAFHPSRMTVEKHRRVMASPTYRQAFDLLAVAADGSLAAYCIVGMTRPIASASLSRWGRTRHSDGLGWPRLCCITGSGGCKRLAPPTHTSLPLATMPPARRSIWPRALP